MDVGKRIIALREEKGWTTNRLANQCGLSQSFVRSVELGERGISVEKLSLICDSLGLSLRSFFDLPKEGDGREEILLRAFRRLEGEHQERLVAFLESLR